MCLCIYYVYMYIHVYTYNACNVDTYIYIKYVYTSACGCIYIFSIYICVNIAGIVCVLIRTHVYGPYTCVKICIHIRVYKNMYTHPHVKIYTMYICIYMYTHTMPAILRHIYINMYIHPHGHGSVRTYIIFLAIHAIFTRTKTYV